MAIWLRHARPCVPPLPPSPAHPSLKLMPSTHPLHFTSFLTSETYAGLLEKLCPTRRQDQSGNANLKAERRMSQRETSSTGRTTNLSSSVGREDRRGATAAVKTSAGNSTRGDRSSSSSSSSCVAAGVKAQQQKKQQQQRRHEQKQGHRQKDAGSGVRNADSRVGAVVQKDPLSKKHDGQCGGRLTSPPSGRENEKNPPRKTSAGMVGNNSGIGGGDDPNLKRRFPGQKTQQSRGKVAHDKLKAPSMSPKERGPSTTATSSGGSGVSGGNTSSGSSSKRARLMAAGMGGDAGGVVRGERSATGIAGKAGGGAVSQLLAVASKGKGGAGSAVQQRRADGSTKSRDR